jgi:hypothetical protein
MISRFAPRPADLDAAAASFRRRLDRRAAGRRRVVWGGGRAGELAVQLLHRLDRPADLIVDRAPLRQGGRLQGLPVRGLDALRPPTRTPGDFVLLASMHAPEMAAWLRAGGWRPGRDFMRCPVGSIYRPEVGLLLAALPVQRRARADGRRGTRPGVPHVTVFASAGGNFYFREVQQFLVEGLRRLGWRVGSANEHATGTDGIPIIVGPHEFFSIGAGADWLCADNLARAVLVTTEQPQSLWFHAFAPAVRLAGSVVDLSPRAVDAHRRRGVHARWLPLGWYEGCGALDEVPAGTAAPGAPTTSCGRLADEPDDPWSERPIDVLFMGAASPRRERLLAQLRRATPGLRWSVHVARDVSPLDGQSGGVGTAAAVSIARRAKVLLNVHRDDTRYFEWQRIVWRGLWQRTLVVTEPAGRVPGLIAGRDYIESAAPDLAATLRRVLTTPAGARVADQVRRDGFAHGRRIGFDRTAAVLAAAVGDAAAHAAAQEPS